MTCDLHIHSVYSDGTRTPAEIIAEAKRLGLAVALTDHNTTTGLPDFMSEAEKQGVQAIPGIELSTEHEGREFHLLGLFIAPEHYRALEQLCRKFHIEKELSNRKLIDRLNAAGYHIDYTAIQTRNPCGNINRAHVAAELLEKGYVSSVSEAFATLLGEDMGYYVPPVRLQLLDAIKLLREKQILPVWAHPLQDIDAETLQTLLSEAIEAGLVGMETYYSSYDAEKMALAAKIADEFHLLRSGGSDFHGETKPLIRLGVGKGDLMIPAQIYHDLVHLHQTIVSQNGQKQ